MKLSRFYDCAVRFGRERDPRGSKQAYTYEDTAILHGSLDTEIRNIFVGIDVDTAELLLADRLMERKGIDLVLSHHPAGSAWASFYHVMQLQSVLWRKIGIDQHTVDGFLSERMREVSRKVMAHNHMRAVDSARLLDIPLMCVHTPADNQVSFYLQRMFDKRLPEKAGDLLDMLCGIPEYSYSTACGNPPRIVAGGPQRACGKVFVDMTGGAEGPKELFGKLVDSGVGTLVSMHLSEEHLSSVKTHNLNVVVAGHISSDTLGMNLLLDRIESVSGEVFTVFECSGFKRIRRI